MKILIALSFFNKIGFISPYRRDEAYLVLFEIAYERLARKVLRAVEGHVFEEMGQSAQFLLFKY